MKSKVLLRFVFSLLVAGALAQAQTVKPYLRIETGAHTASAKRVDVDASGRFLASVSDDKTARIWDLRDGTPLKILRPPIGDFEEGKLYAVAVSPDGNSIAVGGFTSRRGETEHIYIFDRASGAIRKTIAVPQSADNLSYSRDGRYLAASLGGDGGIRVFATPTYSEIANDSDYGDDTYDVEFDSSGRLLTASYDGVIRLYSPAFHLLHKAKPRSGKEPYSAHFSPDGKRIAVGFDDAGAVDVLSAKDLSFQYTRPSPDGDGTLSTVSWTPDGHLCAAGKYHTRGVYPVLCWSQSGSTTLTDFPAADDTIINIHALYDGAVAFAAGGGTVGVMERNGAMRWRSKLATLSLDRACETSHPRTSGDGSEVEIAAMYSEGDGWKERDLRFSVADRRLEIDGNLEPSLPAPVKDGVPIEGWCAAQRPTLAGVPLGLKSHELSRSLAISPDKESFILGTDWHIYKFSAQGEELWPSISVPGTPWGVSITANQRYVVAALGDGTVRWYTFDKGEEVLALFVDHDMRRWVAWNPDGFFAFDGGGDSLIGYHLNRSPGQSGDFIKVDQLRETFYQPDLISQILKPGGAEAVAAARQRIGDVAGVLAGGLPPEIELISPAQSEVSDDYLLQFRVKDKGGAHGRIVYRIDGAEIEGRGAADIPSIGKDTINRRIPIGSGKHTLTVTVYSANGKIESAPQTIHLTGRQQGLGANLYVVAAGISHYSDNSLSRGVKFASADADQVAARFQQAGRGLFGKVDSISLPDSKATIANIKAEVARAAKDARPGDIFVLYLAGHGITVDGEYYFIPYEAEYTNREELMHKSLNREAIQALLKQFPTNKSVLILDTCSAGTYLEGREGGGEKAAQEKISMMSGRAVLAASNSDEMALDGYQGHGVFTFALLEGLQQAESNASGEILITRLAEFVQGRVPNITREVWHYRQTPLSRIDGEPFPIARKPAN